MKRTVRNKRKGEDKGEGKLIEAEWMRASQHVMMGLAVSRTTHEPTTTSCSLLFSFFLIGERTGAIRMGKKKKEKKKQEKKKIS